MAGWDGAEPQDRNSWHVVGCTGSEVRYQTSAATLISSTGTEKSHAAQSVYSIAIR